MTVSPGPALMIAAGLFLAGTVWGRWTLGHSLTLHADDPGATPHRIEGRFYYVVPESEYVTLRFGYQRHKAGRDDGSQRAWGGGFDDFDAGLG